MAVKKYNKEYVENFLKEYGCELISDYIDVKSPITYRCKCGEPVNTSFDSYRNSKHKKCKTCIGKENNANSTITIEIAKQYFKDQGCELLEDEYINSKTKMRYTCTCGEPDYKTWNHFRQGQRCKRCATKKNAENQSFSQEEVKEFLEQHGFDLLDIYVNINTPLKHKCTCGNTVEDKSLATLKANPKCTCNSLYKPKKVAIKRNFTKEELIDYFWKYFEEFQIYPTAKDFNKVEGYPSSSSYNRRWGNFTNFLNDIGVLGENEWYKCDEQILLKMYENEDKNKISESLMVKRSWNAIQQKARLMGLKRSHNARYGNEYLTDEELVDFIKDYYSNNNKIPTSKEFEEDDNLPNPSTYRNRFGSWNESLKKAGFTPTFINKNLTNEELEDIKEMYLSGISCDDIAVKYDYSDGASIYYLLRKMNVDLKTNRWDENKINILKEKYPYTDWEELLELLKPFRKEDIWTKAHNLGIKRECFGWSDEEIAILHDNYGEINFKELIKLLPNKTEASIVTKAYKLSLTQSRIWEDEEITKFKELYPYYTNEELQEFFPNRSKSALQTMATQILGIHKDKNYKEKYKVQTKKLLLNELIKFANGLGRTPTGVEINNNPNMGGVSSYHRYFGSYTNACKEAGLEVNVSIFGKSYHYTSDNGDVCLSRKELEITNLLYYNKINYDKEVLYRDIIEDESIGLIRTDWVIGDIVVEYFGMPEKEYYRERMEMKQDLCEINNVKLISLLPNDFSYNMKGIIEKFKEHGISLDVSKVLK